MIGFMSILTTVLAINLPAQAAIPLIDQCDIIKFKMIIASQIPAAPNFLYTVSPNPFLEGWALENYIYFVSIKEQQMVVETKFLDH